MVTNNTAAVSEADTKQDAQALDNSAKSRAVNADKVTAFVYIGPSLPSAKLMANTVVRGTRKEVLEYYKDVIEHYPNVGKLIVPIDKLAESRAKVRTSGNVLNKYYNDLSSRAKEGAVE